MKSIIINGAAYTSNQAREILVRLKKEYEFYKDRTGSFTFDGQTILTSYAYYLIEYIENCLNEKS